MSDCIFCKVANHQIPAHIIYEDDMFMGFLDIHPIRPGHVLLIPKEHVAHLTEATDEMVAKIFQRTRDLMVMMKKILSVDFVMVEIIGVDVPHLHIHLLPRNHDDGLVGWERRNYEPGEAETIVAQFR